MQNMTQHIEPSIRLPRLARSLLGAAAALVLAGAVSAQQVKELDISSVPPDLLQPSGPGSALTQPAARRTPVDLGESLADSGDAGVDDGGVRSPSPAALPPAQRAAQAARNATGKGTPVVRRVARPSASVERAVFRSEPVRVNLTVGEERLVTLPAPAALSVPSDIEHVARIEIIGPTLYIKALTPFHQIRIVAELIDSGQLIPMDFVAGQDAKTVLPELEVSLLAADGQPGKPAGASQAESGDTVEQTSADMVQLTRHAARQLYAPRRLAWATPGVHQVDVSMKPVPTLIRGVNAEVVPLGQWKSGPLYVTAVRVTNRSTAPQEIPLEQLRGRWISATSQHGRIGPVGSETDTTALYLVCDRAFEACL